MRLTEKQQRLSRTCHRAVNNSTCLADTDYTPALPQIRDTSPIGKSKVTSSNVNLCLGVTGVGGMLETMLSCGQVIVAEVTETFESRGSSRGGGGVISSP